MTEDNRIVDSVGDEALVDAPTNALQVLLAAGAAAIGSVVVTALPAGVIAGMTSLPAGINNIGDVDVVSQPAGVIAGMTSLPAGINNIGDVDVLTLPSIPAGANNIGQVEVTDGVSVLSIGIQETPLAGATGILVLGARYEGADSLVPIPVARFGDLNTNKADRVIPVTPMTRERLEGTKIVDGSFTYQAGPFSINMEIENLTADQNFILIDLSDTTNFPHTTGTGVIYLTQMDIFIGPNTSFRGDVEIGFLENAGADNSDTHPFHVWHLDQASELVREDHIMPFSPWRASSVNHLSSARNLADTGFQTDIALASPYDPTAAFTTVPGSGDIYLRVVRTAGNVDISVLLQYYIV